MGHKASSMGYSVQIVLTSISFIRSWGTPQKKKKKKKKTKHSLDMAQGHKYGALSESQTHYLVVIDLQNELLKPLHTK